MSFDYKNPRTGQLVNEPLSVPINSVIGTNFSIYTIGGYQEVYNLSDLELIFSGTGLQQNSGNTIPINYTIGT